MLLPFSYRVRGIDVTNRVGRIFTQICSVREGMSHHAMTELYHNNMLIVAYLSELTCESRLVSDAILACCWEDRSLRVHGS